MEAPLDPAVRHMMLDELPRQDVVQAFPCLAIVGIPAVAVEPTMFEERLAHAELVLPAESFESLAVAAGPTFWVRGD